MKDEEEIYVTCICGGLVNEAGMSKHFEECLKEDLVQRSASLKINHSSSEHSRTKTKEREVCAKCVRCGHAMVKSEGTLLTFYPSMENSRITSYRCKGEFKNKEEFIDPACKLCKLPSDFHKSEEFVNENKIENCKDNNPNAKEDNNPNAKDPHYNKVRKNRQKWRYKCRMSGVLGNLDCISEQDELDMDDIQHENSLVHDDLPSGPPCKQFHVALLPNYSKETKESSPYQQTYYLLLQILDGTPSSNSQSTQTDLPDREDVGIQVKIIGVYPEEVEELLASTSGRYSAPDIDPVNIAAYQSFLQSLIPCTYCARTFSPDRVMKHQSCCIERPKTRQYMSPAGGEIPR